jgi:SAM-dependent methyltransferase
LKNSAARAEGAPALFTVPRSCYLCRGTRLALRFEACGTPDGQPTAYKCTSFGHRVHPPIWGCLDCGLLFQWPIPSPAKLTSAYAAVEDPLYLAEKANRYQTFRKALRFLGPARGRRLLDVGAYCGYFLDVARSAGFDAEGLELSTWAAGHARSLGFRVMSESLAARASSQDRYDVLTLWDVVEHFADPRAELAAAHRLLAPGGTIHVSTIDAASLIARLLGARWPWLMEMHLFYFDRSTLPMLLEELGFRVLATKGYTHTVSAGYLLRKVEASFPWLRLPARLLRAAVPAQLPIPINLGDNMVVSAVKL